MKHKSKLFISLLIIILCGCSGDKISNNNSFLAESKDTVIHNINVKIEPTLFDSRDTVIHNYNIKIEPVLIDSFAVKSDYYKIYANYAYLVKDTFYFNKTFESLIVTKNNEFLNDYFKKDISKHLYIDKVPFGFKNGSTIELVEIKNLQNKTYSIVFDRNISAPGYRKYAFIDFDKNIAVSDTIFGARSSGFKQKSINASDNSFNIKIFNSLFSVNIPIRLVRTDSNILKPFIDKSKVIIDGNFIVYNVEIHKELDYSKSNDTISLYTNYNSEDIKLVPVNLLKNLRFYKAARFYELLDINNFYKIIHDTEHGTEMSMEDYKKKNYNFNTKWFLYFETKEIKGWIRKKKDFQKLGFHVAG